MISTSVGKLDQYGSWCGFLSGAEIDGHAADSVQINSAFDLAIGGSGELYLLIGGPSLGNAYVARVDTTGTLRTIYQSSGGGSPSRITVGLDGAVYVSNNNGTTILLVNPTTGLADSFAGTNQPCDDPPPACGDNGPATLARFEADDLATGPDGSLFLADSRALRIRRVGPDGIISTFAGTGTIAGSSADGVPATAAYVRPSGIAVDGDGNLYVAEKDVNLVRRVSPDGLITTIAQVLRPRQLALDPNSGAIALFREQPPGYKLDLIGTDGSVDSLVSASEPFCGTSSMCGENGLASKAAIGYLNSIVFNALGELLLADSCRVRKITPVLPGLSPSNFAISSDDGTQQYVFDRQGRHLRTVSALTGATLYSFSYQNGLLKTITDADGISTEIDRSTADQIKIKSHYGQTTTITLTDGMATSITVPGDGIASATYYDNGLLETFTTPQGSTTTYSYDTMGLLTGSEQTDPKGLADRVKSIARSTTTTGYAVTYTSPMLRQTKYDVAASGDTRTLTNTYPDGTTSKNIVEPDKITSTLRDGRTIESTLTPDPRFGMLSPVVSSTTTLPSLLASTLTRSRAVTKNTDGSLATLTETSTLDGKAVQSVFDASAQTWTTTTAAGRKTVVYVDQAGRPTQLHRDGLSDVMMSWDAGRLGTVTHGTRAPQIFTYNDPDADGGTGGDGYLKSIKEPDQEVTLFEHDARGRVIQQSQRGKDFTAPFMSASYDSTSGLTLLSPPGHAITLADSHNFARDERGLLKTYTPPQVPNIAVLQTGYGFDDDGQLEHVDLPDGKISYVVDADTELLDAVILPGTEGTILYQYDPVHQQPSGTTGPCTGVSTSETHDGHLVTALGWSGDVVGSVSFSYSDDNAFRLRKEQVNAANDALWSYDDDGYPTWVGSCDSGGTGTAMKLTWNDKAGDVPHSLDGVFGLVSSGTFGHQVDDTWTKNVYGEVDSYVATYKDSDGGTAVALYSEKINAVQDRDASGRILHKQDVFASGETADCNYVYRNGRLYSATCGSWGPRTYTYDDNGNRLTDGLLTPNAVYDHQDRLTTYGNNAYTYTDTGALKTKANSQGKTTYTYDSLGNLRSVALPTKTITYKVDGRGRRVSRTDGTTTQHFLYRSNLQLVAELDASNNLVARYVYVTGRNVPDYMMRKEPSDPANPWHAYRIITDHLGSVRLVVDVTTSDANQRIAQRIDYDPWGNLTRDEFPRGWRIPFGFAGGLQDRDTGLARFGARDYDPEVGRWTAKDPIRFGGGDWNLYGYVVGDPVNWIDADGRKVSLCHDAADTSGGGLLALLGFEHYWLKTDTLEAGLGPIPGGGTGLLGIGAHVYVSNEEGRSDPQKNPGGGPVCEEVPDVSEECVNSQLDYGRDLGRWWPTNQCYSFAVEVLTQCTFY